MQKFDVTKLFPEKVLIAYANSLLSDISAEFSVYGAVYARESHISLQAFNANGKNVRLVAPVREVYPGIISFQAIIYDTRASMTVPSLMVPSEDGSVIVENGDLCPKLIASKEALSDFMLSGKPDAHQDPVGFHAAMNEFLNALLASGYYSDTFDIELSGKREALLWQKSEAD